MFIKREKSRKKTLDDLIKEKSIITGREVVENLKERELIKKQFEESIEFEERNRKRR